MSSENEYSGYTNEELVSKMNRFKKIQMAMSIAGIVASLAIAIVSFNKNASQGYQLIPIFLVVGIGYPFLAFGGMRKKIQSELDNRASH